MSSVNTEYPNRIVGALEPLRRLQQLNASRSNLDTHKGESAFPEQGAISTNPEVLTNQHAESPANKVLNQPTAVSFVAANSAKKQKTVIESIIPNPKIEPVVGGGHEHINLVEILKKAAKLLSPQVRAGQRGSAEELQRLLNSK